MPRPIEFEEPQPADNHQSADGEHAARRGFESKHGDADPGSRKNQRPRRSKRRRAKHPSEVKGEGVLFPALIIGLGQLGMQVLQRLRESIVQRFGSPSQLPNVRLLLLDTDPEIGEDSDARLGKQRPVFAGHYGDAAESAQPLLETARQQAEARNVDGSAHGCIASRAQMTAGVRALGRLAFIDHYRSIVNRLQSELDACLNPSRAGLGQPADGTEACAAIGRAFILLPAWRAGPAAACFSI